jgi:hypothetical protein
VAALVRRPRSKTHHAFPSIHSLLSGHTVSFRHRGPGITEG